MMARITGGELLVKCLLNEGVSKVFGIPGGQMTTFVDALARLGPSEGIEFVMTRHESANAYMADGWFRITGDLAACTGTIGPGASNMIGGMEAACGDNVPLIAITPQIHTNRSYPFKGSQQQLDQMTLFKAVTKWNALVNRWDRIPDLVATAVREALGGKQGPVHLDIPVDVLFETGEEEGVCIMPPGRSRNTSRPYGDPDFVQEAAELLAKAERPVIHAGVGVLRSGGWDELRELAEHLHCPVVTTVSARGVMSEDHPLCMIPALGGAIMSQSSADVALVLGCTLSETDFWCLPPYWGTPDEQKIIHVDISPSSVGLNREVDIAILGDAKAVLSQLVEAVKDLIPKQESREFTTMMQGIEKTVRDGVEQTASSDVIPIHPLRLVKEVREFFGEEANWALDGGNMSLWGLMGGRAYRPHSYMSHTTGGSGHLGGGVSMALAAKMAQPDRPAYVITGDGAFLFSVMELETASRLGLPVVTVIGNDRAFGMIKGAQDMAFEKRYCGVDFSDIRLDKAAEAMGCFGIRVTDPGKIKPALEKAVESGKPAVLDVVLDCSANLLPPTLGAICAIWLTGCEGVEPLSMETLMTAVDSIFKG
jgi:acetolactate synthase-1/2/3 large subunit